METSELTAEVAVVIERYSEPEKSWGLHLIQPRDGKPRHELDPNYPFSNQPIGLWRNELELMKKLQTFGDFYKDLYWQHLSDEFQEFIVAQVVPMEWKSVMGTPEYQGKIRVWVTPDATPLATRFN